MSKISAWIAAFKAAEANNKNGITQPAEPVAKILSDTPDKHRTECTPENKKIQNAKNKKTTREKEYRYFLLDVDMGAYSYKYYDAKDNEIVTVTANYGGQGPGSAAPDHLNIQAPPANFDYSDASPLESEMPIPYVRIIDLTGSDQEAFRKLEDRNRGN